MMQMGKVIGTLTSLAILAGCLPENEAQGSAQGSTQPTTQVSTEDTSPEDTSSDSAESATSEIIPDMPGEGADLIEDAPQDCGPDQYQDLIGAPAEAAEKVPDPKRVLNADDAMTMDYRPNRTNIELDEEGVITRIWCG